MAVAFRSEQFLSGWRIIPRDHLFSEFPWSAGSKRATATVEARRSPPPRARCMAAQAEAAPRAGASRRHAGGGGRWEWQAARRLVALLKKAIKGQLSAYKVPKHVYIYADNALLPFTDSGKIDKRQLERVLAARIDDGDLG